MQTFLPYRSYAASLACLDYRRLGKQRIEARQIYNVLIGQSNGWNNHPAVRMWADYIPDLALYHDLAIHEWIRRGYKNTMPLFNHYACRLEFPHWLTDEFTTAHRSNLLRKDPVYYSQFNWKVPTNLPYIWPV